jgi:hypothetical protein
VHSLQALTMGSLGCFSDTEESVAGLCGLTQLTHLKLPFAVAQFEPMGIVRPPQLQPWTDATAALIYLKTLRLTLYMALTGGAALLAPLTQLEVLTVDCTNHRALQHFLPAGAEGWAATPAGAVVGEVAAAVAGGWRPLQRLVLVMCRQEEVQQVRTAAQAALPGMVVEVR